MMEAKKEKLDEAFETNRELVHANSELRLERYVDFADSFGKNNKSKRKSRSSVSDEKIKLLTSQLAASQANEKDLKRQLEGALALLKKAVEQKKIESMAVELVAVETKLKDTTKRVETLTKENEILRVKNKQLTEMQCLNLKNPLTSSTSLRSLAERSVLNTVKKKTTQALENGTSSGVKRKRAKGTKSISEEITRVLGKKAKQQKQTTGDGEKRNMDEVLDDVLDKVKMEYDSVDDGHSGSDDTKDVNDRSNTNAALIKPTSLPVVLFSGLRKKAENSINRNMNKDGDISLDIKEEKKRMIEKVRGLDDTDDEDNGASQPSTSQHTKKDTAAVGPATEDKRSCNLCGGSFKQLKQHMYVHSRPYKCDECGKRFSRRDALVTHQQGTGKSMTIGCLMKSTEKQVNATETGIIKHKTHTVGGHSQSDTGESPVRENMSEDAIKEETIVVTVHLGENLDAGEKDRVNQTVSPLISTSSPTGQIETPGATSSPAKHHLVKGSVTSGKFLTLPEGLSITEKSI